jgi:hypothetical protein
MAGRFSSKEVFMQTIAALGLPVADDEIDELWQMVVDLQEEAERLRRWVEEQARIWPNSVLGHLRI